MDHLTGIIDFAAGLIIVVKGLRKVFTYQNGDIPICHTRIQRTGRGFVWDRQIGVHPLPDGRLELTAIEISATTK